jgi:hypothetical protein
MTKSPRIPNDDLLAAGLELMRQNGKELTKVDSFGRSMMYKMPDGETVRVRTCNDHILIALSDSSSPKNAKLNIEGTDFLLVVMPEIERTPGKVTAYLVPTNVAVDTIRSCQQSWLDSGANTKGDNKAWCLWFRKKGKTSKSSDYETKWAEYRLKGEAYTHSVNVEVGGVSAVTGVGTVSAVGTDGSVKAEVEMARQRISKAAGVAPDAVRITIQFGL